MPQLVSLDSQLPWRSHGLGYRAPFPGTRHKTDLVLRPTTFVKADRLEQDAPEAAHAAASHPVAPRAARLIAADMREHILLFHIAHPANQLHIVAMGSRCLTTGAKSPNSVRDASLFTCVTVTATGLTTKGGEVDSTPHETVAFSLSEKGHVWRSQ